MHDDDDLHIEGYQFHRADRTEDTDKISGGGLLTIHIINLPDSSFLQKDANEDPTSSAFGRDLCRMKLCI